MTTIFGIVLMSLALGLPTLTSSLNCSGPLDLVVAVPAGLGLVDDEEWAQLEPFLERLVDVMPPGGEGLRLGLVLYGPHPLPLAQLQPWLQPQGMRARATLLTQRHVLAPSLGYPPEDLLPFPDNASIPSSLPIPPPSVPLAIAAVHRILNSGRRLDAKQVGIVMTAGADDATSSDPEVVKEAVSSAAARARADNITLLAVSTRGTVPGFVEITEDFCRLFSLGSYQGLVPALLPYLAAAVCYVLDPSINPNPGQCFPELVEVPPVVNPSLEALGCSADLTGPVSDPRNCAYFHQCGWNPQGYPWVLYHQPCPPLTLFDPSIRRCNHKDAVACYSGVSCPAPHGLFPHPRACGLYLNCFFSAPYVQSCHHGLWFDSRTRTCQLPVNSDCSVPQ